MFSIFLLQTVIQQFLDTAAGDSVVVKRYNTASVIAESMRELERIVGMKLSRTLISSQTAYVFN